MTTWYGKNAGKKVNIFAIIDKLLITFCWIRLGKDYFFGRAL